MKNLNLSTSALVLLFTINLAIAQVGINTVNPTKTLDINGELRVRNIPDTNNPINLLATDADGNVGKISAKRGKCTASQIHSGDLDLSSKYADDDFDCLYIINSNGYPNIRLPRKPQDAANLNKGFSFKIYVRALGYSIYSNTDGGYIMNNPCGSGATCRYTTFYTSGGNVSFVTSSFSGSSKQNYLNRTLNFTWFNNTWHLDMD